MTLTREELKSLALPVLVALALVVVGALLIKLASDSRREANELLAAARSRTRRTRPRCASRSRVA